MRAIHFVISAYNCEATDSSSNVHYLYTIETLFHTSYHNIEPAHYKLFDVQSKPQ